MTEEQVILVDEQDNAVGLAGKNQAHLDGALHRAFSIFIFNLKGQLLLQQRALEKYHSGGLWANTCCGHPRPGESNEEAAHRRLQEEMGFDCALSYVTRFKYRAVVSPTMIEHEIDHVFIGRFDGVPRVNPDEASQYDWLELGQIKQQMAFEPERFTPWFKKVMFEYPQLKPDEWAKQMTRL
ncbi:MAG: Isopentenyl-diphosphate Delta-isomerase [Pseudomonas sp.]|nr:MAG: Isopentenyl-diphosphate Delta-isomerase [Pseudomonas sp.]